MTTYNKMVNGEEVPMTDAEILQRQAEEAAFAREQLAAFLPAYRYQRENAGITVGGVLVQTDLGSRTNLLEAKGLGTSIKWKTPNGFVTLRAEQIAAIASAVGAHRQKCFDAEAVVEANISEYATTQEIQEAFDNAYSA